jgi:hypothetical protein
LVRRLHRDVRDLARVPEVGDAEVEKLAAVVGEITGRKVDFGVVEAKPGEDDVRVEDRAVGHEYPVDRTPESVEADETREGAGQPEEDAPAQTKEWRAWADEFIQQNEGLLEKDDLVFVTAAKLYARASSRLTKTNEARKAADAEEDFPLDEFNDIQVALHRLEAFTGRIRHELEERFPEQHRERIQEDHVVEDDDPAERPTRARQGE